MQKNCFTLTQLPSGLWEGCDKIRGIKVTFRKHQFEKTATIEVANKGVTYPTEYVTTHYNELEYWLRHNHYGILMPSLIDKRKEMGLHIQRLRIAKGLTQGDVAHRAGLTTINIQNIEAGKYAVNLDLLNRISHALGMKVDIVSP